MLACILLIVAVFATGCERPEEVNIPGPITDLYLAGSISREDIKNIAALLAGEEHRTSVRKLSHKKAE